MKKREQIKPLLCVRDEFGALRNKLDREVNRWAAMPVCNLIEIGVIRAGRFSDFRRLFLAVLFQK